jgi:hypothetical protein
MLVPVQRSWVVGEIVTAAYLNTNVRDATNFLLAPPLCDVAQASAQSIPNNALTALTWDTEVTDNDSAHSTVTNSSRITFQAAGWYHYEALYIAAFNTAGYRIVAAYKNGALYKPGQRLTPSVSNATDIAASGYIQVVVGDYLEIFVYQSSGAALLTDTTNLGRPYCTTRWVST